MTQNKQVILIIDSGPADMLDERLERSGYRVVHVRLMAESFNALLTLRPSLIVCERRLPDGDGTIFCSFLKKDPETRDIPLVFRTFDDASASRVKGLKSGADDYLSKSFHLSVVLARIEAVLRDYYSPAQPVRLPMAWLERPARLSSAGMAYSSRPV